MKMKWNKGSTPPTKSGFYLAWNTWEDDFPVVLHCEPKEHYGWWTYHLHRVVVEETVSSIIYPMIGDFLKTISRNPQTQKKEKEGIKVLAEKFSEYVQSGELYEVDISEVIGNYVNCSQICVYDVGVPSYWAELPNLMDIHSEEVDSLMSGFGDPDDLDIEVEDIKAQVINAVAENVRQALSFEMSRFSSPWEDKKESPPWSK